MNAIVTYMIRRGTSAPMSDWELLMHVAGSPAWTVVASSPNREPLDARLARIEAARAWA